MKYYSLLLALLFAVPALLSAQNAGEWGMNVVSNGPRPVKIATVNDVIVVLVDKDIDTLRFDYKGGGQIAEGISFQVLPADSEIDAPIRNLGYISVRNTALYLPATDVYQAVEKRGWNTNSRFKIRLLVDEVVVSAFFFEFEIN